MALQRSFGFGVLLVVLGTLIALAYFSSPVADDFCNLVKLNTMGANNFVLDTYFHWSGRVVTTAAVAAVMSVFPANMMNLALLAMPLMWLAICALGARLAFVTMPSFNQLALATLAVAALWWSLLGSLVSETVFWVTGAIVYLVPLLTLMLTPVIMRRFATAQTGWSITASTVLAFLWGGLVGCGIELLAVPAFFLSVAWLVLYRGSAPGPRWALIVGVLAGIFLLVLAPGNFVRAGYVPQGFVSSVPNLIANYFGVCVGLLRSLSWGGRFGVLGVLVIALLIVALDKNRSQRNSATMSVGAAAMVLALGFLAYLPVASVPDFQGGRTLVYFYFALALAAVFVAKGVVIVLRPSDRVATSAALILSVGFGLIILAPVAIDIPAAASMREQFDRRHESLLQTAGQPAIVTGLVLGSGPVRLMQHDVSADAEYWVNTCVAEYYHLESITLSTASGQPS